MHRFLFLASAALLPPLVDASLKSAALLLLAGVAALLLRRASSAARHLVWLAAVLALLLLPLLSLVLPGWRVLPGWAVVKPEVTAAPALAAVEKAVPPYEFPRTVASGGTFTLEPPVVIREPSPAPVVSATPVLTAPPVPPPAVAESPLPSLWLSLAWAAGCLLLLGRLAAARWLMGRAALRSTMPPEPVAQAFAAALEESGTHSPVRLLMDAGRTIPVVWGLRHPRLLLPAEAETWDAAQLRSVFLHELAHLRRRDPLTQMLAQLACALHWFNPLVWLAAWRLHVERERACDDLVLARGIRPSEYAGHLLHVATRLSSMRWTTGCGLAMARKSSLEGRLLAVLSEKLNRRGPARALTAAAILLSAAIAIPVAMLRAGEEKAPPATGSVEPGKAKALLIPDAMEETMRWGEPVNGLRAAVVIRHAKEKPAPGEMPDLFIAVQNVSQGPITLNDSLAEEQPRMMHLKSKGRIQAGLGAKDPRLGTVHLQSREVVYIPMFSLIPLEDEHNKGKTVGSLLADTLIQDTHESAVITLLIEKAPEGCWTGKLVTGEATGAMAAGKPAPRNKEARALYEMWQHHARGNGNFPGGLVGRLAGKVDEFIRNNTGDAAGDPYAKKMAPIRPRLNATRDWTPAEIVAIMDDIATVTSIPLETTLEETNRRLFKNGTPLPADLAKAPWGEPAANGLRVAWLLEPGSGEIPLGTALKARMLIHNSGKDSVVFRARTWNQPEHKARDAKGAEIKTTSVDWTTLGRLDACRLEPGEFVEMNGPGIGVGPMGNSDKGNSIRVGTWIETKAGEDVTVTTAPLPLRDWRETSTEGSSTWWLEHVKFHLAQDLPLPADPSERKRVVYRAGMELFGTPLTAEDIDSFVTDPDQGALENLARRLTKRPGVSAFVGDLTSGPVKFRVVSPDQGSSRKGPFNDAGSPTSPVRMTDPPATSPAPQGEGKQVDIFGPDFDSPAIRNPE